MLIKIFDPDLQVKGVLNHFTSLQHTTKFYDNGNFELHTTEDLIDVNDVIVFEAYGQIFGGIVLKKVQTYDDIQIMGVDLKGVMSFRVNTCSLSTDDLRASRVIEILLSENLYIPWHPNSPRRIPINTSNIPWDLGNLTAFGDWGGYVDEIVNNISKNENIGVTFSFDLSESEFVAYAGMGTDRTSSVVFSGKLKSSVNDTLTDDISNAYTAAYVQSSTTDPTSYYGDSSLKNLRRKEGYSTEKPKSWLKKPSILVTNVREKYIECQPTDKFTFGTDYFLGDYVTVKFMEITATQQITEIEQVYEHSNRTLNVTLGKTNQNALGRLLRKG